MRSLQKSFGEAAFQKVFLADDVHISLFALSEISAERVPDKEINCY